MEILLRSVQNRNPRRAVIRTAEKNTWGYVLIETETELIQLAADQKDWHQFFLELAAKFAPRTVATVTRLRSDAVLQLTPADVIAYFEASEVLRPHATDVRTVLEPLIQTDPAAVDVGKLRPFRAELFDQAGRPARGYTRRAAAILFDDESKNGGQYLTRIKAAMTALSQEDTTTTAEHLHDQAGRPARAA